MKGSHIGQLAVAIVLLASFTTGCSSTHTSFIPSRLANNELVLLYDGRYKMATTSGFATGGYQYPGLTSFVSCVPPAAAHAQAAESWGDAVIPLQAAGITLAVGGIGGAAGIAYLDKNKDLATGLILGGIGAQVLGLILVSIGAQAKYNANGNAIDAMNYYNDAVGSRGGYCQSR